eukprot:508911_1
MDDNEIDDELPSFNKSFAIHTLLETSVGMQFVKIDENNEVESDESETPEAKEADTLCQSAASLNKCTSLKRISQILNFYHEIQQDANNNIYEIEKLMVEYTTNNYTQQDLVSDFHHLLVEHLDTNAESYDKINAVITRHISCDISVCKLYDRNGRDRESEHKNDNEKHDEKGQCIMEILDNIHTYLVHGFDIGFRIKRELNIVQVNDTQNEETEVQRNIIINDEELSAIHNDKEMKLLQNHLTLKRKELIQRRGADRVQQNKFLTDYQNTDKMEEKKDEMKSIENQVTSQDISYSFGFKYYYWLYYKNLDEDDVDGNRGHKYCEFYIQPKYDSFKQEIINQIPLHEYNITKNKAETFMTSKTIKSIQRSGSYQLAKKYGIQECQWLSVNNLMSIMFYTDYSALCTLYSATYRALSSFESIESIKKRHADFAHWAMKLNETVKLFGTVFRFNHIPKLYHGVTFMYFNAFYVNFSAPSSMTKQIAVAAMFANNGIILQVEQCLNNQAYFFNCSLLSSYCSEDERLFISTDDKLKINSIRNVSTKENYKYYIKSLLYFDYFIHGQGLWGRDLAAYSLGNSDFDYRNVSKLINILIDHKLKIKKQKKLPMYIFKTFDKFLEQRKYINISSNLMAYNIFKSLRKMFLIESDKLVRFDLICQLFVYCAEIEYHMEFSKIDTEFMLALIKMLNKIAKNNKLTKIKKISFTQCGLKDADGFALLFTQNKCQWKIAKVEKRSESSETQLLYNVEICKY